MEFSLCTILRTDSFEFWKESEKENLRIKTLKMRQESPILLADSNYDEFF
jgi:hypothetical protein